MKNLKAILLLCFLAFAFAASGDDTAVAASGSGTDILSFAGGGEMEGTFLGYDKEGVHWRRPDAREPVLNQTGNLVELRFDSHAPPSGSIPPAHSVLLANGDELAGAVVSLDDKTLLLDTWYAGRLAIPRAAVVSITAYNAGILYRGPDGPDGWVDKADNGNEKCWDYRRRGFVPTGRSDGAIGRDVGLPAMARIECDLAMHRGRQFGICFYSKGSDFMGGSYMFGFNQTGLNRYSIRLTRYVRSSPRFVGQPLDLDTGPLRGDKLHLDIRVNKDLKTFWLYADGKLLKKYIDPDEFAGTGDGIGFYTRQDADLRVSNIKVTAWDGVSDEAGDASAAKEDIVRMANDDKLSGRLKSAANGKAVLESSLADMTIPLDRMERIDFSPGAATDTKKEAGAVRVSLIDGGTVTMQIESWDAKQVTATSPDFGKAVFSPDAFQRLEFNSDLQTSQPDASTVTTDSSSGEAR